MAAVDELRSMTVPASYAGLSSSRRRMEHEVYSLMGARWPNMTVRAFAPLLGSLMDARDGLEASLTPAMTSAKVRTAVNAQKFFVQLRKSECWRKGLDIRRALVFSPYVKYYQRIGFLRYLGMALLTRPDDIAASNRPSPPWPAASDARCPLPARVKGAAPSTELWWPSMAPFGSLLEAVNVNKAPSSSEALCSVEHACHEMCRSMLIVAAVMGDRDSSQIARTVEWAKAVEKAAAKVRPALLGFVASPDDRSDAALRSAIGEVMSPPGIGSIPSQLVCDGISEQLSAVYHSVPYYSPSTADGNRDPGVIVDGCVYSLRENWFMRPVYSMLGHLRSMAAYADLLVRAPTSAPDQAKQVVDSILEIAEKRLPKEQVPRSLSRCRVGPPTWY